MLQRDCVVSTDGNSITVTLPSQDRKPCKIVLTFNEASSLAMTLPRLLKMALRQKNPDGALRHVYPLRGYAVECASDLRHLIVTVAADDGYEVAFAIEIETATAIARDLVSSGEILAESQTLLPH